MKTALWTCWLRYQIRKVEAAAYTELTPAVVRYRVKGAFRVAIGRNHGAQSRPGKVSRPEVAQQFLAPAPAEIIQFLAELRADYRGRSRSGTRNTGGGRLMR